MAKEEWLRTSSGMIAVLFFFLTLVLSTCGERSTPSPTATSLPPTATLTATVTPPAPTRTRPPTSVPPIPTDTPSPTTAFLPAGGPTPIPGWAAYANAYLGYGFNYPAEGVIFADGANGMDANEEIPSGFTYDEYFDYVLEILPQSLCVSLDFPGVHITVAPPYEPLGSFTGPCPGMGIGSDYRMEQSDANWWMAGRNYEDVQGTALFLKNSGAFYGEFHIFDLDNGFRVVFNGKQAEGMTDADYQAQKSTAREVLATLYWFRAPELTKPGTTCAGRLTRLVPSVRAVVGGSVAAALRSEPGVGTVSLAWVKPGALVKVLAGPVCAEGGVFWNVQDVENPALTGWTAEWNGAEYRLDPFRE
jgi:hypothetical protein